MSDRAGAGDDADDVSADLSRRRVWLIIGGHALADRLVEEARRRIPSRAPAG